MDGIETLAQVTLTPEPQTFSLSFDTYKLPDESDDGGSPKSVLDSLTSRGDEPATAGEHTPGSPGSATDPVSIDTALNPDDSLNTPVSTSADVSAFFNVVPSISDPIPITGRLKP